MLYEILPNRPAAEYAILADTLHGELTNALAQHLSVVVVGVLTAQLNTARQHVERAEAEEKAAAAVDNEAEQFRCAPAGGAAVLVFGWSTAAGATLPRVKSSLEYFASKSGKAGILARTCGELVMHGHLIDPCGVPRLYAFIKALANADTPMEAVIRRFAGGRVVALTYLANRLRAGLEGKPGEDVPLHDIAYLHTRIQTRTYTGNIYCLRAMKFLVPIFLAITEVENPFTVHEWSYIMLKHLLDFSDLNAVRAQAAKAPLSKESIYAAEMLEVLHPNDSAMVRAGGFVQNIHSTHLDARESGATATEHLSIETVSEASRDPTVAAVSRLALDESPPPSKRGRTEQTRDFGPRESAAEKSKRSAAIRTGRCRFCGHKGHSHVFKTMRNPTHCPIFMTSPNFRQNDPFEFCLQVERGQASPVDEHRKGADGKDVPIPPA